MKAPTYFVDFTESRYWHHNKFQKAAWVDNLPPYTFQAAFKNIFIWLLAAFKIPFVIGLAAF
jgi:hypothetical protein